MQGFSLVNKKDFISVKDLLSKQSEKLSLTLLKGESGLDNKIESHECHFPGFALSGFFDHFHNNKIQFIGDMEWHYLNSLSSGRRRLILGKLFEFDIPAVIITSGRVPHKELLLCSKKYNTPLVQSKLGAVETLKRLSLFLENYLSPKTTIHSSLVDVYGIGLLYTGRSGIGKSECVLDLIERGHRLVADDIVTITKENDRLIGRGSSMLGHHMEIRGIGIIDIESLFGVRAIRSSKNIEVVVELVDWDPKRNFERLGLTDDTADIMGVKISKVVIPIFPGKNITVISEVIAMNMLQKYNGVNTAKNFNDKLLTILKNKQKSAQ